ncbi:MAG: hypothetical protein EXR72_21965 [Myxococcales bacterium]|nr:hypothetical protein [Myxococcales bacterium]
MGIFDRMSRLIKSSANSAIDKVEDPSKQIDQLVLEMEQELRNARGETQKMMATRKRVALRVGELEKEATLWSERAEKAVLAGDDELAKLALERRMEADEKLAEAKAEQREAADYAEKLQDSLKVIEAKVKDIKMRKGTIKAKVGSHRAADVRAAALDDFDRVAGKVDDAESAVEVQDEMAREGRTEERDADVERKFAALERTKGPADIDDRLAALKRKMEEK